MYVIISIISQLSSGFETFRSRWYFFVDISLSLCILRRFNAFRYRRYFGVVVPHKKAAVFTARRCELIDVMDQTLTYLDRTAMVRIYSPYSDVPRYVSYIALSTLFSLMF